MVVKHHGKSSPRWRINRTLAAFSARKKQIFPLHDFFETL
jgi:hypothetical protein